MGVHRGARRVPLREAAQLLGVSKDALRQRIRRGTIRSDKGDDGRVYVYLDDVDDAVHEAQLRSDPREQLIAQLRGEVEAWREESRRKDHIIAGLVERIPPQLEAPASPEQRESGATEMAADEQQGRGPVPDAGGPSEAEGAERVSWWRRVFGG